MRTDFAYLLTEETSYWMLEGWRRGRRIGGTEKLKKVKVN